MRTTKTSGRTSMTQAILTDLHFWVPVLVLAAGIVLLSILK